MEFLAPKRARVKKNRPQLTPRFRVLEADGCRQAFDSPQRVRIEGEMPDGRRNRVTIQVASVEDFLVMKGFALAGRDKPKDDDDIYFSAKNCRGGPLALANVLRPKLRLSEVRKGLEKITKKFRGPEDFGPATVVRFLNSPDPAGRQFQQRDALEQIHRLLQELGLSHAKKLNRPP